LDGHILQVNSRFCEIAGYPCAELLGKTCEEITLTGDWEAEQERLPSLAGDPLCDRKRYRAGQPCLSPSDPIPNTTTWASRVFRCLSRIFQHKRAEEALPEASNATETLRGESRRRVSHQAGRDDSRFQ
jgi:PAS domain-containing protein